MHRHQLCRPMGLPILRLAGWLAGLTEVSEGRAATFPHPSAAAQQAVGPQPNRRGEGLYWRWRNRIDSSGIRSNGNGEEE